MPLLLSITLRQSWIWELYSVYRWAEAEHWMNQIPHFMWCSGFRCKFLCSVTQSHDDTRCRGTCSIAMFPGWTSVQTNTLGTEYPPVKLLCIPVTGMLRVTQPVFCCHSILFKGAHSNMVKLSFKSLPQMKLSTLVRLPLHEWVIHRTASYCIQSKLKKPKPITNTTPFIFCISVAIQKYKSY